ncbi:MAG: dienelactone hydrolase [Halobacteriales archaeon]
MFTATMLASHGYPALAVKYVGPEGPIPDDLLEVPLAYFDRAAEWLRGRSTVRDGDLGVYGASKGGEGALFLAAYADWVGAVVADVPSGVAFEGLTPEWRWAGSSSWAVDGDHVPYVPGGGCFADTTDDGLYRMAAAYECALSGADEGVVADATFPVENCDGPILCVSGEQDEMWPSPRLSEFVVDRLREHDAPDRIDHRAYEKAGHAIPIPYRPTYGLSAGNGFLLGGTPKGNANASADYWPRALETFGCGLE